MQEGTVQSIRWSYFFKLTGLASRNSGAAYNLSPIGVRSDYQLLGC